MGPNVFLHSRALHALLAATALVAACGGDELTTSAPPGDGGVAGAGGSGAPNGGQAGTPGGGSGGRAGGSTGKSGGGQAGDGSGGRSGSEQGMGGSVPAGASGAASGGSVPCETTNDCAALVPETKPAGCAKALCDEAQKFCRFVAKDIDGDGDPSNSCKSQDPAIAIELGGDCDESDDKISSKAWDGPEGLAGGEQRPNRCDDGVDNDCNLTVDDSPLDDGTTCKCAPNDVRKCAEDSAGKPIKFPGGNPQGECKLGNQTCNDKGKWGPCTDAQGPAIEECNGKDDDCDGETDEIAEVTNPVSYFCDADGDDHVAKGTPSVKACAPGPKTACAGKWISKPISSEDCNDADATVYKGAPEFCDAKDNDCDDLVDEDKQTTYYCDADKDGVLVANPKGYLACELPADGCPNGQWLAQVLSGVDCDDTNKDKFEGNKEICDDIDNNCNDLVDEGVEPITWYRDGDDDGFFSKAATTTKAQCSNPGKEAANCPPGEATCVGRWSATFELVDCNDANADIFPGAWDGPEALTVGMKGGWTLELFARALTTYKNDVASGEVPTATRVVPQITAAWGIGKPATGVGHDNWLGRATGTLVTSAPATPSGAPKYTFEASAIDGVRVWIDGVLCIDSWVDNPTPQLRTCEVELQPGEHAVRVEFYEENGSSAVSVSWSGPGIVKQPLKIASDEARPNRCGDGKQNCSASAADSSVDKTALGQYQCGQGVVVGTCVPGVIEVCSSPSGRSGMGECRNGWRQCLPTGEWGGCTNEDLPAALDPCDGLDNDCDGVVDEDGKVKFYCDADKDGYTLDGAATKVLDACRDADGAGPAAGSNGCAGLWTTANNGGDCGGDANIAINPKADELCDGVDNDCDDAVDEGFSLGASCHVNGDLDGACRNGGSVVCDTANTKATRCKANSWVGGTSYRTQRDPINNSWDWNCNGTDELAPCIPSGACENVSPQACAGAKNVGCPSVCGGTIQIWNCYLAGGECASTDLPNTTMTRGCR